MGLKALFLVHTGLVPIPKLPKVPPQAPTLWAGLVSHVLLMYPRTLTLNRMVPSSVPWNCGLGTLMKLCARLSSKQLTNVITKGQVLSFNYQRPRASSSRVGEMHRATRITGGKCHPPFLSFVLPKDRCITGASWCFSPPPPTQVG